ncbi:MAG TPA: YjbQ family protein, partial [Myxococcota bacterium]|nr:YjbQ family protein [Myxococcota bacterium]
MLELFQRSFTVTTRGSGLHDITSELVRALAGSPIKTGACDVFVRHTSCSLVIQENADPTATVFKQRPAPR